MRIRVVREPSIAGATLGCVFVDGHFLAFSLEDELREIPGQPVEAWKVPGVTAIPAGRYRVRLTWSPRFNKILPEVIGVPGFEGIRVHAGNTAADSSGCLLLGVRRAGAALVESRPAMAELQRRLDDAEARHEDVWIEIENPPGVAA